MNIPQEFENLGKRDLIRIILELKQQNAELEKRLLVYENSNTPSSKSNNRKYPEREPSKNPIGAPKGHEGKTRPYKEPDKIIDVKQNACNRCRHILGEPIKIDKRIIEDIPNDIEQNLNLKGNEKVLISKIGKNKILVEIE